MRGFREARAGDKDEERGSRGASATDDCNGAGERGERGGEGATGGMYFGVSSLFTFMAHFCDFGFGDVGEPYCIARLVEYHNERDRNSTYKAVLVNQLFVHRGFETRFARHQ